MLQSWNFKKNYPVTYAWTIFISIFSMISLVTYILTHPLKSKKHAPRHITHDTIELPHHLPEQTRVVTTPSVIPPALMPKPITPTQTASASTKPHEAFNPIETKNMMHDIDELVRPGDTLSSVLKRAGINAQTWPQLLKNNAYSTQLTHLRPNQIIKIKVLQDHLEQLTLMLPDNESLVIRRSGTDYTTELHGAVSTISKNELVSATIQGSLYNTAKRAGIPYSLIEQMTTIFHGAINFRRDVRAGDQFTILYCASYKNNRMIKIGNILAMSFTHQGKTYQANRHKVSKNQFDYFTPQGNSLKQSFSRYPVQFTHISSMFSLSRMHPMLHYRRPHQGVDLVAPMGTPVYATGDGRIEQISHHSGYGNMIKISHQRVYSSIYAHLLRFQKGLSKGDFVRRGQLIGYVGRTGLAEGPHCHYEFHINHLPHNPSTVTLPHAALPPRHLAAFKTRANQLMLQLKRYEMAQMNKHTTTTKT